MKRTRETRKERRDRIAAECAPLVYFDAPCEVCGKIGVPVLACICWDCDASPLKAWWEPEVYHAWQRKQATP